MHLPACPKVYLAPDGSSAEYGSILVERNKRVKQDLVLSADLASLYAMTHHKVGLREGPRGWAVGAEPSSAREHGRGAGHISVLGLQRCSCLSCPWSCLRPTLRGGLGQCSEWASPMAGWQQEALGSLCELREGTGQPRPPPRSIAGLV